MLKSGLVLLSSNCTGCGNLLFQLHRSVSRAAASKTFETIHHVEDLAKNNLRTVGVGTFDAKKNVLKLTPGKENDSASLPANPKTLTASKLTKHYSSLSKFRLTGLVVCSAVTGYAMAPMATIS